MRKIFALLFTLGVTFCTAATAHAQVLKVNVTFDFVVDGKILPAATYTVLRSLSSDMRGLAFLGDKIGVDLFLAAVVALGTRVFLNLSLIRRYYLTKAALNRRKEVPAGSS